MAIYITFMLIKKYTPNWIKNYTDLKREIDNGLQGLKYKIEHVGSTAVPELASKPIIDVDIIYENQSGFEEIKFGLTKIGYFYNGNQGIAEREVFKRSGTHTNRILDVVKHHLYVCPIKSVALERHLLFRDYLRKNEWARFKYQEMKYELAKKANQDKELYAEFKELILNDFIDEIIEKEKLNVET